MLRKNRSPLAIFLICGLIALFAVLVELGGWLDLFEIKTVDARFRLRYWVMGRLDRISVSKEVVLIAVDRQSVDPTYSDFSDRWGMGGWLTRDHWTRAVYNFAQYYKPDVVAYDILFMPYEARQAATSRDAGIGFIEESIRRNKISFEELTLDENFPRLAVLKLVDASGNAAFADSFNNIDNLREGGHKTPDFLTAYYLTRTSVDSAPAFNPASVSDQEKIKILKKSSIPSELISNAPANYPYLDNVELPFDSLLGSAIHFGYINVDRDRDGNIRRIPLINGFRDPTDANRPVFVPSMALQACLLHLGIDLDALGKKPARDAAAGVSVDFGKEIQIWNQKRRIHIPVDRTGCLFLNFTGKVNDFRPVPYVDINRCGPFDTRGQPRKPLTKAEVCVGETIRKHIENKIALIGVTFTGATDVGPCAIDSNAPFSLIHLTAIDNILRESFLHPLGGVSDAAILGILLFMTGFLNTASRARVNAAGTMILAAGYLVLCIVLFCMNVACLPMVLPILSILVAFGAISLYRYQVEQKARIDIRKKFSTMVSGDLLEQMEDNPESLALGGERRDVTIFFSDVAGFTSVAETLTPTRLVEVINTYLTPMTEIILEGRGYLNKFLGDGIMAVWGAPLPLANHAEQACRSALAQQRKIAELAPIFLEKFDVQLKVRMGIHSGPVDAGNMGSLNRFEYTVMGDAVNLAARLEPANKDYGTRIILGRGTFDEIQGKGFATRLLDRIVVQGKTEPVEIYELMGTEADVSREQLEGAKLFEEGLRLHWERKWDESLRRFEECLRVNPADGPARALIERVREYQKSPPSADWKGDHVRAGKN